MQWSGFRKNAKGRRKQEKLNDAKEELESKYSIKVLAVQADICAGADNETIAKNTVKKAIDEFGRIDVLINNAQASASGITLAEHTTEQFNLALYSGLYATFYYIVYTLLLLKFEQLASMDNLFRPILLLELLLFHHYLHEKMHLLEHYYM